MAEYVVTLDTLADGAASELFQREWEALLASGFVRLTTKQGARVAVGSHDTQLSLIEQASE